MTASLSTLPKPPPVPSFAATGSERPAYVVLAEETCRRVEATSAACWTAQRTPLPTEVQHRTSKNGRFHLEASAWRLEREATPLADVRMVLITGSKNTIINTWAFPYRPDHTPVFAAELIALAGAPRLTFMDIQIPALRTVIAESVQAATRDLPERYRSLRIDEIPPAWAIEATAGNYLFARQQSAERFPTICQAYLAMLERYLQRFVATDVLSASPLATNTNGMHDALDTLHAYQIHHLHSSPGKVFLGKVFGEVWTESFLTDFLFQRPGANP